MLRNGEERIGGEWLEWIYDDAIKLDYQSKNVGVVEASDQMFKLRELDPLIGAMLIAKREARKRKR